MNFFWFRQGKVKKIEYGKSISGLRSNGERPDRVIISLDEVKGKLVKEVAKYIRREILLSVKDSTNVYISIGG